MEGREGRREREREEGRTDELSEIGNGKPNRERCEGAHSVVGTASLSVRRKKCCVLVNFNNRLSRKKKHCFVMYVSCYGVNTPAIADFKLPT